MFANRRLKYFVTLFVTPFLISGLFLHPAITTLSHADSSITSDGTMGTNITQAGTIYNVDGGTIRGSNQFHSFGLFSVGTGDTASFNGPEGISNIIGRVTGGQQSVIDGMLRSTISGANLYLLNPYGVLFGRNASLNVTGSFHVSTADYLRLSDGGSFYSNPLSNSVLTTAPPAAFGFLNSTPSPITIQESFLQVPRYKTLSVIGGDIDITGGPTGYLYAPSGRINLASVASPGEVIPIESRDAPDLQLSSFDRLGNIHLSNLAYLAVDSSAGSGAVVIRGGRLQVAHSSLTANTTGNTDGAKVGIDIKTTGDFAANNGYFQSGTTGRGSGGDILITANSLELRDGSEVITSAWGEGTGGTIHIVAKEIVLDGGGISNPEWGTGIYSNSYSDGNAGDVNIKTGGLDIRNAAQIGVGTSGDGNAGTIHLELNHLNLTEGSAVFAGTYGGRGKGGNLIVDAAESILLSGKGDYGSSGLYSNATGQGDAGNIRVSTPSLVLENEAIITADTLGDGRGGNIDIEADSLNLSGGAIISSSTHPPGLGAGGNVEITAAQRLSISGSSPGGTPTSILSTAIGNGDAGSILISSPQLTMNGGLIGADTLGDGQGGNISISVSDLSLANAAMVSSGTHGGAGKGGAIAINAADTISISGKDSGLYSISMGPGTGGNIETTARNVFLGDGSTISASSTGLGDAGNIDINAANTLRMRDSSITTEAQQADGGNVHIRTEDMVQLIRSKITASVGGGADTVGGNITIDPRYVILNDSQIIANAYEGRGGNIRIIADVFLASPESIVDASSALGIDGTVDIRAPVTNISGTLAPMQGNFLSTEALLRDRCIAKIRGEKVSSFVVSGRDGLPIRPGTVLPSPIY